MLWPQALQGGWPRVGSSGDEARGRPLPPPGRLFLLADRGRPVGDLEGVECFDLRETENLGFQG